MHQTPCPRRPSGALTWLTMAGLMAACVALAACDSPPAPDASMAVSAERFSFTRTQYVIVRLDTSSGQVSIVPQSGDGGWTPLGAPPGLDDLPPEKGRFGIYNMAQRNRSGTDPSKNLMLVDTSTGRAWIAPPLDGAAWTQIADSDEPVPVVQPSATPAPIPALSPEPTTNSITGAELPLVIPRERFGESIEEQNESLEVVLKALNKEGMPIKLQIWAVRQLAVFDPELAVPPLLDALDNDKPEVVVAAIHSLEQTGDATTIPRIMKLRNHPDPRVRAAVAEVVVEAR
jgi:hypothetical protein